MRRESGQSAGRDAPGADSRARTEGEPAYVLHTYAYRETSLLVEAFSREHGRVTVVARGARRPKSALRGVLTAFQPLQLSWFGRSELRTLHRAEWQGGNPPLTGMALMCGFYLNELLLKFLARDDPHEALFDLYHESLTALADSASQAPVLRRFERRMLAELGYAMSLEQDAEGRPVSAQSEYRYEPERGPVLAADAALDGFSVAGRTLLDMARDQYGDPLTLQQSRTLMRALIQHHLGGYTLHTRQLLKDLLQI